MLRTPLDVCIERVHVVGVPESKRGVFTKRSQVFRPQRGHRGMLCLLTWSRHVHSNEVPSVCSLPQKTLRAFTVRIDFNNRVRDFDMCGRVFRDSTADAPHKMLRSTQL